MIDRDLAARVLASRQDADALLQPELAARLAALLANRLNVEAYPVSANGIGPPHVFFASHFRDVLARAYALGVSDTLASALPLPRGPGRGRHPPAFLTDDQRSFLRRFIGRGWLSAIRDDPWEQETVDLALRKRWMRREYNEAHFTPKGREHLEPTP